MKKYNCFVISPIGEPNSEIRENADILLEMIIKPAIVDLDFIVERGEERTETRQIGEDVINMVQGAELCICDISDPNPNVFYELGRRDETGKPIILLKRDDSPDPPRDILDRRFITYSFIPKRMVEVKKLLHETVKKMINDGLERSTRANLSDIATSLNRLERKIERIVGGTTPVGNPSTVFPTHNPVEQDSTVTDQPLAAFAVALKENNIPVMEAAMEKLQWTMDHLRFLEVIVEVAAARGSRRAGQIMIDRAHEYIDSHEVSFHKKIEYLGRLVGYISRADMEMECLSLIEEIASILEDQSVGEDPKDIAQIYNQKNRMYFGIYLADRNQNVQYLDMAIDALLSVKQFVQNESYVYYNLALCYREKQDLDSAMDNLERVLQIDHAADKQDSDHISLACELFYATNDPRYGDTLATLKRISPMKAALLDMQQFVQERKNTDFTE